MMSIDHMAQRPPSATSLREMAMPVTELRSDTIHELFPQVPPDTPAYFRPGSLPQPLAPPLICPYADRPPSEASVHNPLCWFFGEPAAFVSWH